MDLSSWYGPQFSAAVLLQILISYTLSGSGPYTLTFPYGTFFEAASFTLYYTNNPGSPPVYGPIVATNSDTEHLVFSAPSGAPAPTSGSTFFWENAAPAIDAPITVYALLLLFGSVEPGLPPPVTYYPYSGTITPSIKPGSVVPTGTPTTTKSIPAGLTASFDPPTLTLSNPGAVGTPSVLSLTAAAGMVAFDGVIKVSVTDEIIVRSIAVPLTIGGDVTPAPPFNFLYIFPGVQGYLSTGPGTTAYEFIALNQGPDPIVATPIYYSEDRDITITFSPATLTVPPGTVTTPGEQPFTALLTIANPQTAPVTFTQIQLGAGTFSAQALVNASPDTLPFLTLSMSPPEITVASPGSNTSTLTITNSSPVPITLALTAPIPATTHGITASLSPSSLTLPAGSLAAPSSMTATATVTTPTGVSLYSVQVYVTATNAPASTYVILSVIGP